MLYLIGLGLGDAEDITVKGLQIIKHCKRVYLEIYTSILSVGHDNLEKFYGRTIILADRKLVEQHSDEILDEALTDDIAFLVVGDPFGATTHSDLILRAIEKNVPYRVVHNASIMNAVGCCGLQLYNFGETVSIVFWTDSWRPDSFYDKIARNRQAGLHTLCLLDIKVKEQTIENLMKGNDIYEQPQFMTASQAAEQLMDVVRSRSQQSLDTAYDADTLCVGLARVGSATQRIAVARLKDLIHVDLGDPLHSLVIVGHTHPLEKDMLKTFAVDQSTCVLIMNK